VATYSFNGMDLRVVEIGGEPWFVAADVCGFLTISNTTNAVRHLSQDELKHEPRSTLYPMKGGSKVNLISESGLYKLVMRSDKKEAKQFQEWVTREVLPSIRKTGTYTMPGAKTQDVVVGRAARGITHTLG
jgi:prophage antirepressor-like protein